MAANTGQGRGFTTFLIGFTAICAGVAYMSTGIGKLVLAAGAVIFVASLFGFLKIKPLEGKPAQNDTSTGMKLAGALVAALGWGITLFGLHLVDGTSARIVLAVGVEQMTTTPGSEIGRNLLKASYVREEAEIDGGFAGIFGKIAGLYFQKWGDQSDALALIAAKNHKNGVGNPYAQMRKDLGYEFCRTESEKNPFVAGPLKRTDCSLVSDGAAAVVLADVETALTLRRAVAFRAAEHVQDFLPMSKRDILKFEGCSQAWRRALDHAGLDIGDLSFVETHDCFTIAELIEYEAMGLTAQGAIKEGWTQKDGKLPVNPSGGLKAKGHPIGATGVSMHALSAMQLTGTAGDLQVNGARLGGIFNMGGTAVANYVSILERIK